MTPETNSNPPEVLSQADFRQLVQTQLRSAVRSTLLAVLEEEVEAFIGAAPYQRTPWRRDQRNGTYTRKLDTSVGRIDDLPVPRTRQGFQTQLFERYHRRQAELDQSIQDMFVRGVSTQHVGAVLETLTEVHPSASTVSRVFHTLEAEFTAWKDRPLETHYLYLFADGTYFTVIYNAEGHKMPILAVVGIKPNGEREVLAFTVGDRENQQAWEDLLDNIRQRGVQQVDLWVTDGHQAMLNAISQKFAQPKRQRCVKHKMENVLSYVPDKQRDALYPELRALFYQDTRLQADQAVAAFCVKYEPIYPTAIACLQRDLEACLTFYDFPKTHWRSIRTTNLIERLFGEVKKRSHKMAAAFRNEGSCLLMFYAVIRLLKFHRITVNTDNA